MGCSVGALSSDFSAHYTIEDKIKKGTYGLVCSCSDRKTSTKLAVKIAKTTTCKETVSMALMVKVWKRVNSHQHVVSLIEHFSDHLKLSYLVMERCDTTLLEFFAKKSFKSDRLLDVFRQILLGVQHCHEVDVAHRDVKPENVLVGFDGKMKLCDFGCAATVPETGLRGMVGTAPYMSPEMVSGQSYNQATDIWSCGVSAYLLFYGEYPYKVGPRDSRVSKTLVPMRLSQMMHAIVKDEPSPAFTPMDGFAQPSDAAQKFVRALLERSVSLRPDAAECLNMSCFAIDEAECSGSKTILEVSGWKVTVHAPQTAPAIELIEKRNVTKIESWHEVSTNASDTSTQHSMVSL